jgi:hypothetical protein
VLGGIGQEEARRKAVQLKLEMAKFLEDALYLRSLQISHDTPSAATFAEAMKKVRPPPPPRPPHDHSARTAALWR